MIPAVYFLSKVSRNLENLWNKRGREIGLMTDKEQSNSVTEEAASQEDVSQADAAEATAPLSPEQEAINKLEAQLAAARAEAQEYKEKWVRAAAEFENYKKRTARETESFKKFANENIIKDMLSVVDNLERALSSSQPEANGDSCIAEGVEMTRKEILKVFEKYGVVPVEAMGQPFDPAVHEAVMQEQDPTHPANTVIRELQRGYTLHGRLLRPAMVVVSAGGPSNGGEPAPQDQTGDEAGDTEDENA